MRLAVFAVAVFFAVVALASVMALVLLDEADAAGDEAWSDCPDEVER